MLTANKVAQIAAFVHLGMPLPVQARSLDLLDLTKQGSLGAFLGSTAVPSLNSPSYVLGKSAGLAFSAAAYLEKTVPV
jgi:hypothetical protein